MNGLAERISYQPFSEVQVPLMQPLRVKATPSHSILPRKLGVKNVGIAPTGKTKWSVSEKMSEAIRRERAQVEGVIENLKSKKYGFNKLNVKSTVAMEMSGHRSCLGFNLCKALRKLSDQQLQMA